MTEESIVETGEFYMNKKELSANRPIVSETNLYWLFWIFVLFSVMGFAFESFANLIEFGHFHNRQGLLYLPFSQIYGIGAIIIIITTRWIKNRSVLLLYIFCCLFGGFFEYIFSYIEEMWLHSATWNYSTMPFNIGGRTNLLFALAWGFVGVAIVKWLYPLSMRILSKLRGRKAIVVTWVVFIILSSDIILSSAMVYRQYERIQNIPPSNIVDEFLDKKFPESVVKKTYPSLRFTVDR